MWKNVSTVEKQHSAVLKKEITAAQMSIAKFFTHTQKLFGVSQGSTAPCSLGNLCVVFFENAANYATVMSCSHTINPSYKGSK